MGKRNPNQSSKPATTADLDALKTEIIAAVKDTVQGLATQETVSAVQEMLEELSATHDDVRYVRTTVTMLTRSEAHRHF
jgi:hypothetical protein